MSAKMILGRDQMGPEATEEDYRAFVAYVRKEIDEECGFAVEVVRRRRSDDDQTDDFEGTDVQREMMAEARDELFWDWCDEGGPSWLAERAPGVEAPAPWWA